MGRTVRRRDVLWLGPTTLLTLTANRGRGASPPHYGGELILPLPHPVRSLDPTRLESPFESSLAAAVFDGLYGLDRAGRVEPTLAAGPPEVAGTTARIRLREGVLRHGGRPLTSDEVVRSLQRVWASPAGWLLGTLAREEGRPIIRAIDSRTVEIEVAHRGIRPHLLLAAAPLAIVAGGNLGGRPSGTGAFSASLGADGGVDLSAFRHAATGAPWLRRIRFEAPMSREEELRAFELGQLHGSWWGASLYGSSGASATSRVSNGAVSPVLLVPNRAHALRTDALWGGVAGAIDRRRLERIGLTPRARLARGLPPRPIPTGSISRGLRLRMPVRRDRPQEIRIAEALAGMMDERGVHLEIVRQSGARHHEAVRRGSWDLRLATVLPPLPGRGALAGAALAAAGQPDQARLLAPRLGRRDVAEEISRNLDALVLGHQRSELFYDARYRGLAFDEIGRLSLAEIAVARPETPLREPLP